MMPNSHRSSLVAVLTLVATLSGCSDDGGDNGSQKETNPATMDPPPDAGATGTDAAVPVKKGPLLIMTERTGVDTTTTLHYLHILPDWPASGQLDYGQAIELGSPGVAHAEGNAFFFYHADEGSIEKFPIDANGKLGESQKMSFGRYGIKSFDPEPIWVAPDLAFMLDERTGQIVRFNPATMEIGGSDPVNPSTLMRGGLNGQFQNGLAASGRLFTVVNWRTWQPPVVHESAALGVFDQNSPANGPQIIEDDRCASSVAAPPLKHDGYVYVVGDGASGFDQLASTYRVTKPQCVVRMPESGTEFDRDFFIDLQALTQSPAIRMAYPMAGHKLLVNLWSPDVPRPPTANGPMADWFWESTDWEFGVIDLSTKTFARVPGLRGKAENQKVLIVDGKNYVQLHRPDRSSIVYRIDPDATATKVLDNPPAANLQFLGRL
jgi:hypothetical protein